MLVAWEVSSQLLVIRKLPNFCLDNIYKDILYMRTWRNKLHIASYTYMWL